MPWTEPLADPNELRRCIRDLVALSTLPAGWLKYDMRQIGGTMVAALVSLLDAAFVFIALPAPGDQINTELAVGSLAPEGLKRVQALLQREKATLGSGPEFILSDPSDGRDLHVVTAPIGFGGDAILAAGSRRDTFPSRTERLILNTGANQAAIAFQQWLGDAEKRRFTAGVQRTTDFVGIASLSAMFSTSIRQVFNWWDLTHSMTRCGFTCSISFRRKIARPYRTKSGLWCFVPAGGRESLSSGILDPVNQSPS